MAIGLVGTSEEISRSPIMMQSTDGSERIEYEKFCKKHEQFGRTALRFLATALGIKPTKVGDEEFLTFAQARKIERILAEIDKTWILAVLSWMRSCYSRLRFALTPFGLEKLVKKLAFAIFPFVRIPVRKRYDPCHWTELLKPSSYYWVHHYPEMGSNFRIETPELGPMFKVYGRYFYSKSFNFKSYPNRTIDPLTGEPNSEPLGSVAPHAKDIAFVARFRELQSEVNYFHFHFDVLAKLKIFDDLKIDPGTPVLVSQKLFESKLFHAALARGGLSRFRWMSDAGEAQTFRSVLIPRTPPISKELIQSLREYMNARRPDVQGSRRVYLCRRRPDIRVAVNSEEVVALLQRYGFEIVVPAGMTLDDQIDLMSSTRYLVVDHGAAVTNAIYRGFAPFSVLELLSPARAPIHLCWITHALGGKYYGLLGKDPSGRDRDSLEDFYVDVARMEEILRKMLAHEGGGFNP